MLKKSNDIKRLVQPLPLFAAHLCRLVNFDVKVTILKKSQLAAKGTVKRMKLTEAEGDKEKSEALMEKAKKHIGDYPTLEIKKGWVTVKGSSKKTETKEKK